LLVQALLIDAPMRFVSAWSTLTVPVFKAARTLTISVVPLVVPNKVI